MQWVALGTQSSIYTRTARARCWPVTSVIPGIHPSDGPSHTIMLSNKIVPFLSSTPNTTDFIHASRWPHPSPGFLLAGHKSRSQWESGDSQQFCAMERSGDPLPSDLQVSGRSPRSARGRSGPATSWREPRLILTASSQAGGRQQPAACVCKESESEPVTAAAAAAVLCQHSLQSGVSWRRPSGSFACHGPTIPLATHPVHLTGIHSDFSRCIFHHHGKLVVVMSHFLISLIYTS